MEIKIRNVDPVAVKKLDEMAKKKGISRQEFLKSLIEKIAYEPERNESEMRLELVIQKNTHIMEEATKRINNLEHIISELMEE